MHRRARPGCLSRSRLACDKSQMAACCLIAHTNVLLVIIQRIGAIFSLVRCLGGDMKKLVVLLALATLVASCAPKVWVKPGVSQQEFTMDRYNCEKDARQSGYFGTGLVGAINMSNFFDSC